MTTDLVPAPWDVDDLLDSDPLEVTRGPLASVWAQLHANLHAGKTGTVEAFCEIVRRKPRTSAKLVALHLADRASGPLATLIDDLLVTDRLVYAHYRGSQLVANAIRTRWSELDANQRAAIAANIRYCESVTPSFAWTRDLIAAVPEAARDAELASLLAALGGAPAEAIAQTDHDVHPAAKEGRGPESAPRTLAQRMEELPGWLAQSSIPWGAIAQVIDEDERAHPPKSPRAKRVFTGEAAARCADIALAAIADFGTSSLSDDERIDILRVADICLAHPALAHDDAANERLITALRSGVFAPPARRDVAVYALNFIRTWHWREARGRELVIHLLGTDLDPDIVNAAIDPLHRPDAGPILEAASTLVADGRATNEKAAESLGRLMGEASVFLPPVAEELHRWLHAPPETGILATPEALKEFLGGVAFAIKSVAERHDIDTDGYATWATELWALWRAPRCVSIEGRGSIALQLMAPLRRNEKSAAQAPKYWRALLPLFKQILESGDSNEIYGALYDFDADGLVVVALDDLVRALRDAARAPVSVETGVSSSRERIAEVLLEVAVHPHCRREHASAIHQTLISTGARKQALDLERVWRQRG